MRSSSPAFHAPDLFKLLAHDLRWGIVSLLARSDYSGQELVRLLRQPQNLVSYHLKLLSQQHLINERRNNADERSIYFSLDLETLRSLYLASGAALHPALRLSGNLSDAFSDPRKTWIAGEKPRRVLFLCTHNSARSQMAEGMLRALSHGSVEVASAGGQPTELHPMAIRAAASLGVDIQHQRAKSIDQLPDQTFDDVITVCDLMREACPTFPGEPERIHWSIPDPVVVEGSDEERYRAFVDVAKQLMLRIRYFLLSLEDV